MVLIAGPSSSGKTTFAQRLGIQLRLNGLKPVTISVDNYFVERQDTPRDENGEYNFECIEAIDLKSIVLTTSIVSKSYKTKHWHSLLKYSLIDSLSTKKHLIRAILSFISTT